jgi:catechol 2,3-dioxygenase-like lactoylglutathione lyase family enzyme
VTRSVHPEAARVITHVKFVTIPTHDQDRALTFYTEKLGFRVLTDQPHGDGRRWIELRVGTSDTRVVLFTTKDPPGSFYGTLACDNVERTYEELKGRGVEFVAPPKKEPWGTFAIFKDIDGNQFVLSTK